MRALSVADILAVWERAEGQQTAQRALTLLAAACPEMTADELGALSIGERDARLLMLRESTFGSELLSRTSCPRCAAQLEFAFSANHVRAESQAAPTTLKVEGGEVRFRLPNSRDLETISAAADIAAARRLLVERCLLHEGEKALAAQLPPAILEAIAERMADADPQAEVRLALTCPACSHCWEALFDIVSFLWSEISAWAQRLLREVHTLASAYGWREADILAMNARRRRVYLEMVGS
jgi:hypothetical protein